MADDLELGTSYPVEEPNEPTETDPLKGAPSEEPSDGGAESCVCDWFDFLFPIFFLIGIASVITIILVMIVSSLLERPIEFAISSATVSVSVSSSTLYSSSPHHFFSDFDLTVSVRNPNKGDRTYYKLEAATLFYGSDTISDTSYDRNRNDTTMRVKLVKVDKFVDGYTEKGFHDSAAAVIFPVKVVALIRYWDQKWQPDTVKTVECNDVLIGFTNSTSDVGYLVGPLKRCIA